MFTELDIPARHYSVSAPGNRGCMDRQEDAEWLAIQAEGQATCQFLESCGCPTRLHAVGLLNQLGRQETAVA